MREGTSWGTRLLLTESITINPYHLISHKMKKTREIHQFLFWFLTVNATINTVTYFTAWI